MLGVQKLKMNLENVRVFNEGLTSGENLSNDYFVPKDPDRYHPAQRGIPMTFEYLRSNERIPKHRYQIPASEIIFQYTVQLKCFPDEVIVPLVADLGLLTQLY